MNKPHIGVIGLKGLPAFGGAATVGENLISVLKHDYYFTVYSVASHANKPGEQDGYYQIIFKCCFIKKLNIFSYYVKSAIHALFKAKYNMIHLHHIDGAFILPLLKLKYKVITTVHAQPQLAEKWPWYVKAFFSINERISLMLSDELTCVSKILWQKYINKYKKSVIYIPNGVKITREADLIPLKYENYILFAAGRIIPLKGLHILLSALKKINYNSKLLVLGDINQMPDYKSEIFKLSKDLNVEFQGLIREKLRVLSFLKQASLFVFPSYSENMSIMLLEAASMNTPIICSDIPENKIIFNDQEVIFFKSRDIIDLSIKIDYALNNKAGLIQKSVNAFNKLSSFFTWEKIAAEYTELYKSFS
jgi:glycosyltransferase involved in cell wall biosynthesis